MAAELQPLLVVEDRDSLRRLLERVLAGAGYRVVAVGDVASARGLLERRRYALVLTDLKLPDGDGIDVLRASRSAQPRCPVVVMTAFGSVTTAVEAMKLGAADFLEKPVEIDDLLALVAVHVGRDAGSAPAGLVVPGGPMLVGRHPRFRAALRLLERVAPTDTTVLLLGASGTGKELFARALHGLSKRAAGPFVAINCAAIPETLMESELFGHEKGAFTGASRLQRGRFELATGGTLLLDEIGELPLGVQAKVLRVLEERTFQRVGGAPIQRADLRLVAATNRDLGEMVAAGSFRADLYYRLDVFPIELPSLRERPSDVPDLARHLIGQFAARNGSDPPALSEAAASWLMEQPWPGNVRQLSNLVERALILIEGATLDRASLEAAMSPLSAMAVGESAPPPPPRARGSTDAEQGSMDSEEEALRLALRESGGDRRRAAELLDVSLRTLQRKIRRYDLGGFPEYRD
ncbi:MAG TPA: sigma-54 dependent transcriptional regulator [Thermoanaerobaculia bacterium]|nr:sigma-54 dependent transcriptional regulator [Thermoanaerobaculia bacterium]